MAVCATCRSMTPDKLRPRWDRDPPIIDYLLHTDLESLHTKVDDCPLCRMFYDALQACLANATPELKNLIDTDRRPGFQEIRVSAIGSEFLGDLREGEPLRLTGLVLSFGRVVSQIFQVFTDEVRVLILPYCEDDPTSISGEVAGLPLASCPLSTRNMSRIRGWLETCRRSHRGCQTEEHSNEDSLSTRSMPTRLIKISRRDNLHCQLYEPDDDEHMDYVALSHCWGTHQIMTTRLDNVAKHKAAIPYDGLSKTFQDAIRIARSLEIWYLWVDSLCIIQDSESDWLAESPKMASIYQNAYLTVAAASAKSGTEGFLNERESSKTVKIDYVISPRVKTSLYIRQPAVGSDTQADAIENSHLQTRAWCFQERILSNRILHFTKNEIWWECKNGFRSEGGQSHPTSIGLSGTSNWLKSAQIPRNKVELFYNLQNIYWQWIRIISVYSSRGLTYDSDKLPALSGLALRFAQITGDEYLAGMWKGMLPIMLLWRITSVTSDFKLSISRSLNNGSPSWSWTSIEGKVQYSIYDMPVSKAKSTDAHKVCFNILEYGIVLYDPLNPYGQVRSGRLTISGYLASVTCSNVRIPPLTQASKFPHGTALGPGDYAVMVPGSDQTIGYCAWDDSDKLPSQDLLALRILSYEKETTVICVIYLVPSIGGQVQEYRRVGVGRLYSSPIDIYRNVQLSTIEII